MISASRTKDLVRCNADLLAAALCGAHPVRFGLAPHSAPLDLEHLGALVLWTCDPSNLTAHRPLREALEGLERRGVVLSVQLTVTGLAGSAVEPGVPDERFVLAQMQRAIDARLIRAEAVTLRFDPFARFHLPGGRELCNADPKVFERVLDLFSSIGVTRVVTSQLDVENYPHVAQRFVRLGIEVLKTDAESLVQGFDAVAKTYGIEFAVCCHPALPEYTERFGCIDGRMLNALIGPKRVGPFSETLHNQIGKQRPDCCCTYSRDIGHSKGFRNCFSFGTGCLYCYAQRGLPPQIEAAVKDLL